ncbi:LysE family transporter [Urechidicola croceus]|uniref:Uncharacterized protein n=1 Tax=Urechidicola croceus TaxID=1850246 RepID=A0A1D8P940_9FLAO|nr:LysE family transporter [Urechidicola croceus]AOW21084.1 hypothetical protein LPB138_10510 [Urechidicola croceus]
MSLVSPLFLGFIVSFLGILAPSMLNMTAVKISILRGFNEAKKFAIGVAIVVLVQSYIATLFSRYLSANPTYIDSIKKVAILVFVILSISFFLQSKKEKRKTQSLNNKSKNSYAVGLLLSVINMFAIPFYVGVTTILDLYGWFDFSQLNILLFAIGSAIGTYSLLVTYANFANKIQVRIKGLIKNINLILSILTGVIAVISFLNL